jgi:hypothetical protein
LGTTVVIVHDIYHVGVILGVTFAGVLAELIDQMLIFLLTVFLLRRLPAVSTAASF